MTKKKQRPKCERMKQVLSNFIALFAVSGSSKIKIKNCNFDVKIKN